MDFLSHVKKRYEHVEAAIAQRRFDDPSLTHLRRWAYPLGTKAVAFDDPEGGLRTVDESKMTATFVVSTDRRDRHGDVVLPDGCKETLGDYAKNPVVFFSHKSDGLPIGLARDEDGNLLLDHYDGKLISTCRFHGKTRESEDIFKLVAERVLVAASIGFLPFHASLIEPEGGIDEEKGEIDFDSGGLVFDKWSLLEWSVVAVPANPDAVRSYLSRGQLSPIVAKALAPYAAASCAWANGWANEAVIGALSGAAGGDFSEYGDFPRRQTEDFKKVGDSHAEKGVGDSGSMGDLVPPPTQDGDEEKGPSGGVDLDIDVGMRRLTFKHGILTEVTEMAEEAKDATVIEEAAPSVIAGAVTKMLEEETAEVVEETPAEAGDAMTPYGCQVLCKLHDCMCEAVGYLDSVKAVLEQPKVAKYVEKIYGRMTGELDDIKAFGKATYPDHWERDGGEERPADDSGMDDEEEKEDWDEEDEPWHAAAVAPRQLASVLRELAEKLNAAPAKPAKAEAADAAVLARLDALAENQTKLAEALYALTGREV